VPNAASNSSLGAFSLDEVIAASFCRKNAPAMLINIHECLFYSIIYNENA
jgi:hypothetical protein